LGTLDQPPRILIVDDDSATLRLLTAYLVSDGYTVVTAGSEREVLGYFESTAFDLVLLDLIHSPLDRSRICRRIKESSGGRSTTVIVSADAHTLAERAVLHDAGADDFLSKPYRRTELLLRVGATLRSGSLSRKLQDKTLELKSAKTLLRKQAVRLTAPRSRTAP